MAEMESGKPSRGRPRKLPEFRKRNFVTLRLRDETKAALMRAAEANQRSLSEELEARIETALTIFGGPRTQGLLRALAAEVIRRWGTDDEWLSRWLDRRATIEALKQRLDLEDSPDRLMTELQDVIENCILNSGLQEARALAVRYYRIARQVFPNEDWAGLLCPIIELSREELAIKVSQEDC